MFPQRYAFSITGRFNEKRSYVLVGSPSLNLRVDRLTITTPCPGLFHLENILVGGVKLSISDHPLDTELTDYPFESPIIMGPNIPVECAVRCLRNVDSEGKLCFTFKGTEA